MNPSDDGPYVTAPEIQTCGTCGDIIASYKEHGPKCWVAEKLAEPTTLMECVCGNLHRGYCWKCKRGDIPPDDLDSRGNI